MIGIEAIKRTLEDLAAWVVLAGLTTAGGYLAIKQWRLNPLLPLAGLLFGPIFGMFGASLFGAAGGIGGTFVGCILGPGAAIYLQDPATRRRIVDAALSRLEKNPPAKEGEEDGK